MERVATKARWCAAAQGRVLRAVSCAHSYRHPKFYFKVGMKLGFASVDQMQGAMEMIGLEMVSDAALARGFDPQPIQHRQQGGGLERGAVVDALGQRRSSRR